MWSPPLSSRLACRHQKRAPTAGRSCTELSKKSSNDPKNDIGGKSDPCCSLTKLDIYLFHNNEAADPSTAAPSEQQHHLELNRQSSELASNTLSRLVLNLTRKLCPTQPRSNSKKKKRLPGGASAGTDSTTDEIPKPTVWTVAVGADDEEEVKLSSQLDVSTLTNTELWNQARTTPLAILVPIQVIGGGGDETTTTIQTYTFLVDSAPPTITAAQTFEDFRACLFVGVPTVVQIDTIYATHCRVDWYVDGTRRRTTVTDARTKNDRHCFTPRATDTDQELAIVVTPIRVKRENGDDPHNGKGCEQAYRFSNTIEALPDNTLLRIRRQWLQESTRDGGDGDGSHPPIIRVVTYNTLAHQNAFSASDRTPYYPYVTSQVLSKERRLPLILQELLAYRADVICLQEVDESVFEGLLDPVLTSRQFNYQGYYAGKASDGTREGCALFWSLDRFHPVPEHDQKTFVINELLSKDYGGGGDSNDDWKEAMSDLTRLLDNRPELHHVFTTFLGHIVQMVPLELRSKDDDDGNANYSANTIRRPIWVANTHLFYHPQASHIRLLQIFLLARQLGYELQQRPGEVVVCGDFNSSLQNAAGKLLLDRFVPVNFRDTKVHLNTYQWGKASQPEREVTVEDEDFPATRLPASFPVLRSGVDPTPAFTHYIDGFQGTLDHVLYSPQHLRCQGSAPMPTDADVTADTAMPSAKLPSDHVSLVCDLAVLE